MNRNYNYICCPRDCVSQHNGGTSGAPLKPLRDDSALSNLEHIILHCPHIQTHRFIYNVQSLEHLWTRPVEVYNFLHDAGVLQSTRTSPPHTQ